MLDSNVSIASLLNDLPHKEGVADIVETSFDPKLVPYLIALVAKKKLRAVFMHETIKEQERRERLVNQTYSEDFMGYMHARNHIFSSKPFRVNIEPDQSLKSPSMDGTELPELLKREMKDQAVLLDASFKNFGTSEALAFTSADNSGTFPMHQDGNYITLHKTLIGRHGMSYMPQPITNEQKALARNRLKFSAMFKDDPSLTDTIPTGTLSIFGTEFYHASSGVESVSVGSVLSMDCIPVSLTHDL